MDQMDQISLPSVDDPTTNANTLFAWLQEQPVDQSSELAEALFVQLLDRASKSRSTSVNACTKLCGFVQHCAVRTNADTPARAWAFRPATAERLFHFYMEWNEKDQHRSMKLVLDLLALLVTQNPDAEAREAVREHILQSLVTVISHRSTRPLVKSAIASLNHLLAKSVYTFDDVARAYGKASAAEGKDQTLTGLALWQQFVRDMFAWMTLHYVCPVAGKLLVSVFAHLHRTAAETASGFTVELWLQWLRDGLAAHTNILEDVKLYLFIPLFKNDCDSSLQLLQILNQTQTFAPSTTGGIDSGMVLQLAALEVGKKAGLVSDAGLHLVTANNASAAASKKRGRTIVLNESVLDDVLARAPADVRSLALSLLVSSQSTTKPFSATAFALLQKYLPGYHAESDAKFRYELLAHTRDMSMRIKGAVAAMERALKNAKIQDGDEQDKELQETLQQHEAFLTWYLAFLRNDLAPTASYQRHFTALRATTALLRMRRDVSGGVGDALDDGMAQRLCSDSAWVRCVLDLLVDPFEDVRETAAALLAMVVPAVPGNGLADVLTAFSARADDLASRTARADHADGAARCQGLLASWAACDTDDKNRLPAQTAILDRVLDGLEAKIARAETDLGTAAVRSPVHGEFASIRYIWDVLARAKYGETDRNSLEAVQARIVRCCERVWQTVRHVLCDDSPEGHLPQEMEDVAGLDSKDLLSYSFRAVNESSNTMRSMIGHLRFSRVQGTLCPGRAVFEAIGALSFAQLAALRHRGALSTVAQTFTLCCQLAQDPLITTPGTPAEDTLVMGWYKGTLDCIALQVSTTRRSAGIPALFVGILAANAPRPSLEEAMNTACEIAQQPARVRETDGSRLPQVHALNCLRDVFRSSLLSKRAERMLPACLQLAANMLQAEVWAIRNCGLLLLRSLIDCLFGAGESKASLESGWDGRTIRVSYNKYPTLPGVLLDLLRPEEKPTTTGDGAAQIASQQAAAESVFPALDILRRAGPPETHRKDLYSAVVSHLQSRLWHVREMAARTVCSFLVGRDWAAGLDELVGDIDDQQSANCLHGTLLAIRFVLGRAADVSRDELPVNLFGVRALLYGLAARSPLIASCPEVEAAYLAALNTISRLALDLGLSLESPVLSAASPTPSALLRVQRALQANYAAAGRGDRAALQKLLDTHLAAGHADPDTAAQLLEAVAQTWTASSATPASAAWLCDIYADICLRPPSAVPSQLRAAALVHLAETLDGLVLGEASSALLARVWAAISGSPDDTETVYLGPTLACAVLRASGSIVAALTTAHQPAWAAMMARAGEADQTFDARMAAAESLRSFAQSRRNSNDDDLAFVFCVYDALNDDDDEIRDVAAAAAGVVLSAPLVPAEAARRLPAWMAERYGRSTLSAFRSQAVWRMVGKPGGEPSTSSWPAASSLLEAALHVDDALFMVEEQNLYVDEVREAQRWAAVVQGTVKTDLTAVSWLVDGLSALVDRVRSNAGDDGPLGWTASPGVFAVCAHLLVGARALTAKASDDPTVQQLVRLLDDFCAAGKTSCVHGLLLAMASA